MATCSSVRYVILRACHTIAYKILQFFIMAMRRYTHIFIYTYIYIDLFTSVSLFLHHNGQNLLKIHFNFELLEICHVAFPSWPPSRRRYTEPEVENCQSSSRTAKNYVFFFFFRFLHLYFISKFVHARCDSVSVYMNKYVCVCVFVASVFCWCSSVAIVATEIVFTLQHH